MGLFTITRELQTPLDQLTDNDRHCHDGMSSLDWYLSLTKRRQRWLMVKHGLNPDKEILTLDQLKKIYRKKHGLL